MANQYGIKLPTPGAGGDATNATNLLDIATSCMAKQRSRIPKPSSKAGVDPVLAVCGTTWTGDDNTWNDGLLKCLLSPRNMFIICVLCKSLNG